MIYGIKLISYFEDKIDRPSLIGCTDEMEYLNYFSKPDNTDIFNNEDEIRKIYSELKDEVHGVIDESGICVDDIPTDEVELMKLAYQLVSEYILESIWEDDFGNNW